MERFNIFKLTIAMFVVLFMLEISNISFQRNYLFSECNVISYLIGKEGGLSNQLMNYLNGKDYQFIYEETNKTKIGEIVSYTLIKEYDSLFFIDKKIIIEQNVILGSYR